MPSDTEREVYEKLTEAETTHDLFEAVEPLKERPRTVESELLVNAAGHMMGEALLHESRRNKYE